jgi:hypothetical protein
MEFADLSSLAPGHNKRKVRMIQCVLLYTRPKRDDNKWIKRNIQFNAPIFHKKPEMLKYCVDFHMDGDFFIKK